MTKRTLLFQVIELDFTDTLSYVYYITGKLEDELQHNYMHLPLGRRRFRCLAGHPCRDHPNDMKTVKVPLAYSFQVVAAIRSGDVVLVR